MTCTRCGSWQGGDGLVGRFCSNCGTVLSEPGPQDHPTYVQPAYAGGPVAPHETVAIPRDRGAGSASGPDRFRHPGTWIVAAAALLVAGIVLAAVIVASGGSDEPRDRAAAGPSTGSTTTAQTSPVAPTTGSPFAPTQTQTVVVVPAAPGTPAVTRTVTVQPDAPAVPGSAAGAFSGASQLDAAYFQRGNAVYFDSPSHNIGCRLIAGGAQAQCTIATYDFPEPGYDCDDGVGVLMDAYSRPSVDCISGSAYSGGTVLGYGESLTFGNFSCVSRNSGVTCADSYGSGFTLSRGTYTEY